MRKYRFVFLTLLYSVLCYGSDVYISVDMEADGPIPGDYSMQSIGAVVVGDPSKTFYVELKPISNNQDAVAASIGRNIHGEPFSREYLETYGLSPEEAMQQFVDWLDAVCEGERAIFVAYPLGFDFTWIHWYMIHFLGRDPFGIGGVDMRSYFMGQRGKSYGASGKPAMMKLFPSETRHSHNALDDAIEQAEIFSKMVAQ